MKSFSVFVFRTSGLLYRALIAVIWSMAVLSPVVLPPLCRAAEPPLRLYTEDGKPHAGWSLPDFEVTWHRSSELPSQWQEYHLPLVAHYQAKGAWQYSHLVASPRQLRSAYREGNDLVGKPGCRTLIWVHAEGCGPCEKMRPFMPEVAKSIAVESVDWDRETPGEFKIKSVPLTILVDADNREIRRWTGYANLQTIKNLIKE